jgi:TRAP-type uncharacterized transport system substrate-binding protein
MFRTAAANVLSDTSSSEADLRQQRRSRALLVVLALGIVLFGALAGTLYFILRPVTLRIAVGPPGSADQKIIEAMRQAFASESRTVRLVPVTTAGADEALALLGSGNVDIAVGRADRNMPEDAQMVAVFRKNFVVLWSFAGLTSKSATKKPTPKVTKIADLTGHKVGVIGQTPANVDLLRVILGASGVDPNKVAITPFSTEQIEELARDPTIDAFMTVSQLNNNVTPDVIAATARIRGEPKFLAVDASEAHRVQASAL